MFIGIVGSICAGKSAVAGYLIEHHGFTHLGLSQQQPGREGEESDSDSVSLSLLPPFSPPPPQRVVVFPGANEAAELRMPTVLEGDYDGTTGDVQQQQQQQQQPQQQQSQQQQQQQQQNLPIRPARARTRLLFPSPNDLVHFVTRNWSERFVTDDIPDITVLDLYSHRPFFLLVSVDAPLIVRWDRYRRRLLAQRPAWASPGPLLSSPSPLSSSLPTSMPDLHMNIARATSLDEFVVLSDTHLFGPSSRSTGSGGGGGGGTGGGVNVLGISLSGHDPISPGSPSRPTSSSSAGSGPWASNPAERGHMALMARASVRLINPSSSLANLYAHLGKATLLDPDRLRPSWDAYFMMLASLAARRSNCMKRRVGCVVSRDRRIVSTGYNGTPRGMRNCGEGGCPRCNNAGGTGASLASCLCIHAEENALLEAGRERLRGGGAVLYCDTCPCLTCSIKIVQAGIVEVVYSLGYNMDAETAAVFREAGVRLRQFVPPTNSLIHLENFDLQ